MKCNLFFFCILLSKITVSAQSDSAHYLPWYFDVTVGINQSNVSGSEVDFMQSIVTAHNDGELIMKSRTGIDLGILFRRSVGQHFHFKTGLQYIQRGTSLENTRYVVKPTMSTDYLGLPFSVGLHTASYRKKKKFGLFVETGMSYFIVASDRSNTWITEAYPVLDLIFETGGEFRITESLTFGLRYKYMKDLNHAYTFARQYGTGNGNYDLRKNYDYFYTTNSLLASLRLRLKGN